MPFQYILANLLAQNEDAVGVLFLDGTGEVVDLACGDYTPYQMRVLGAYLGIYFRQLQKVMDGYELGEIGHIHLERDNLHIHASTMDEGYYLVLVQRRPALVGGARRTLQAAAGELSKALF
jgi:hypothetical protein